VLADVPAIEVREITARMPAFLAHGGIVSEGPQCIKEGARGSAAHASRSDALQLVEGGRLAHFFHLNIVRRLRAQVRAWGGEGGCGQCEHGAEGVVVAALHAWVD
jgi:hypothetical protein